MCRPGANQLPPVPSLLGTIKVAAQLLYRRCCLHCHDAISLKKATRYPHGYAARRSDQTLMLIWVELPGYETPRQRHSAEIAIIFWKREIRLTKKPSKAALLIRVELLYQPFSDADGRVLSYTDTVLRTAVPSRQLHKHPVN